MRYCNVTSIYSLNSQKFPSHFSYSLGMRLDFELLSKHHAKATVACLHLDQCIQASTQHNFFICLLGTHKLVYEMSCRLPELATNLHLGTTTHCYLRAATHLSYTKYRPVLGDISTGGRVRNKKWSAILPILCEFDWPCVQSEHTMLKFWLVILEKWL